MTGANQLTEILIHDTIDAYLRHSATENTAELSKLFLANGVISDGSGIYSGYTNIYTSFLRDFDGRCGDYLLHTEIIDIRFSADRKSAVVCESFTVKNDGKIHNGESTMHFVLADGVAKIAVEIVNITEIE